MHLLYGGRRVNRMSKGFFVDKHSIVRRIWGKSDTILFIFAGAAAEFALNKAVDWLYFTGRLPVDPLGRLFSTVAYARTIVFSEKITALRTIDAMAKIHAGVETKRGYNIPDWAYRDVLFMLIDYSIRSFEVLERPATADEKKEIFDVFFRVGQRMGVKGLPESLDEFIVMRHTHLKQHLQHSDYTEDLFRQYRKHLGIMRYQILRASQSLVVPDRVRALLRLRTGRYLFPLIALYKLLRKVGLDWLLKELILPDRYKKQIRALDATP